MQSHGTTNNSNNNAIRNKGKDLSNLLFLNLAIIWAQWKYHGERLETQDNNVVARTCLEGNTHRLADVGNRGQRPRQKRASRQ